MQPGDVTTRHVTMDTYLVAQCAQSLSRYAKQAECRLLLPLNFFGCTVPWWRKVSRRRDGWISAPRWAGPTGGRWRTASCLSSWARCASWWQTRWKPWCWARCSQTRRTATASMDHLYGIGKITGQWQQWEIYRHVRPRNLYALCFKPFSKLFFTPFFKRFFQTYILE